MSTDDLRTYTTSATTPPLKFNTTPVTLSGKIYLIIPDNPNNLPAFGPGTSVQHQATGGVPDYTYTSSDTAVAVVDQRTGLVTVRGRGTASITVTDKANQSESYTATVTEVIHCVELGRNNWETINNYAASVGARLPSMDELREIYNLYGGWPMDNNDYWSSDWKVFPEPSFHYHVKNLVTGTENLLRYDNVADGVGIR